MASRHDINRIYLTEGLEGEFSQAPTKTLYQANYGIRHLRGRYVHPRVVKSLVQPQNLYVFELSHMTQVFQVRQVNFQCQRCQMMEGLGIRPDHLINHIRPLYPVKSELSALLDQDH